MNQEKIANIIKKIRKDNNLTQKEFASIFGVTYQAVSKWENAINIPDIVVLKEISEKFNIDINELLDGDCKNKNIRFNKLWLIVVGLVLFGLAFLVFKITDNHDFTFKTLSSSCEDFNVLGSIAYNNSKTSIYISNINCLDISEDKYNDISCTLYEQIDNTKVEISKNNYKGVDITLNEYLENVVFNIEDYESTCKNYAEDSLFIELKVKDKENKAITYEIPLILKDNCVNSTSS